MNTFTVHLQDVAQTLRVGDVVSFVGQDAGGEFAVWARHERMMTSLAYGLARYRTADERWHYLVMPGGLLYFLDNELFIATRRFFLDDDADHIVGSLERQLRSEEQELLVLKRNLEHFEQELLRRMWRMELERRGSK